MRASSILVINKKKQSKSTDELFSTLLQFLHGLLLPSPSSTGRSPAPAMSSRNSSRGTKPSTSQRSRSTRQGPSVPPVTPPTIKATSSRNWRAPISKTTAKKLDFNEPAKTPPNDVQDKYNVPVTNAYHPISPTDNEEEESDDDSIVTIQNQVKIPPIIIPINGEKIETMSSRIKRYCKNPFTLKYMGAEVSVRINNIQDYNNLKQNLKKLAIPYHILTPYQMLDPCSLC
uniref:Uncharacterized protein n=1 Tax=Cacopsylla melanoneura TaxID=428564 RepID=A0A8D9F826_9HEMI